MFLIAETGSGTLFLLAVVALTASMLLLRTHRQVSKTAVHHPGQKKAAKPALAPRPASATVEYQRWEVRMHEVARELSAKLDCKISALEQLVREAHEQTLRLDQALAPTRSNVEQPAASPAPSTHLSGPHSTTQAAALGAANLPVRARRDAPSSEPPLARRQEEVYAMADQGLSSQVIANRLGSPVGEIELILGLRKDRRKECG
jgi:hypothetical protein